MKIQCKSKGIILNYDNTVWPCCWVCTNAKTESRYLKSLPKDWNSLGKHKLEKILSHEAFTKHFNDHGWNDEEKVDEICKEQCDIEESQDQKHDK